MNSCGSQLLALSSSGQVQVCDERGIQQGYDEQEQDRDAHSNTNNYLYCKHIIMDLVMFLLYNTYL